MFGGSSPGLKQAQGTATDLTNFGSTNGQKNENEAGDFYSGILSGDPSKISQVLAPEIKAGQDQIQQQAGQNANFGNRSGGVNASTQGAQSAQRGNIISEIGQLQSGAAQGAAGLGENQIGSATTNNAESAQISQQELQNMMRSILGSGIYGAEGIGLGALGKALNPVAAVAH